MCKDKDILVHEPNKKNQDNEKWWFNFLPTEYINVWFFLVSLLSFSSSIATFIIAEHSWFVFRRRGRGTLFTLNICLNLNAHEIHTRNKVIFLFLFILSMQFYWSKINLPYHTLVYFTWCIRLAVTFISTEDNVVSKIKNHVK